MTGVPELSVPPLAITDGSPISCSIFSARWSTTQPVARSRASKGLIAGVLGRLPALSEVEAFVVQNLSEWNTGVRYLPGIDALVGELASEYRLAVVTNTHDTILVPSHLEAMGLLSQFDAVITSVEVG
jgi:putative hydrolase of the HAD superfamily